MCRLAQAYIDNLKATGQCEDGVICGRPVGGTLVPGAGGAGMPCKTPSNTITAAKTAKPHYTIHDLN